MLCIPLAIGYDAFAQNAGKPVTYTAEVAHAEEMEEPALIEVAVDWANKERVREEIRKTFPEAPNTMVRVAECESGLIATATGPTNDHGIFQLHVPSHKKDLEEQGIDVNDPADNIKFARYLYENGGLSHWRASKKCWSK